MNHSDPTSTHGLKTCPGEDRLARYRTGGLEEVEAASVREHIARCAECASRLEDLCSPERIAQLLREARREIPLEVRERFAAVKPAASGPRRKPAGD